MSIGYIAIAHLQRSKGRSFVRECVCVYTHALCVCGVCVWPEQWLSTVSTKSTQPGHARITIMKKSNSKHNCDHGFMDVLTHLASGSRKTTFSQKKESWPYCMGTAILDIKHRFCNTALHVLSSTNRVKISVNNCETIFISRHLLWFRKYADISI